MDTSTVDVETSRWCHDAATERGLTFVDAPISGGTAGAEAHSLTFMLGGRPDDVERARLILQTAIRDGLIDNSILKMEIASPPISGNAPPRASSPEP